MPTADWSALRPRAMFLSPMNNHCDSRLFAHARQRTTSRESRESWCRLRQVDRASAPMSRMRHSDAKQLRIFTNLVVFLPLLPASMLFNTLVNSAADGTIVPLIMASFSLGVFVMTLALCTLDVSCCRKDLTCSFVFLVDPMVKSFAPARSQSLQTRQPSRNSAQGCRINLNRQ